VPIGISTGIAAWRLLEHDHGIGFGQGADVPGAALITAALTIGVYAIVGTGQVGWASTQTLVLILASLVLLGAFVVRESRTSNPLLPLRIFRSRHVSGANAIQLVVTAAMFGVFFLTSIYLERVLGFDAFLVGIGFLPISLSIGALSLGTSAALITRFGPRSVLLPGLGLMAGGLLLLSAMPATATYLVNILPALLLFGLGAGLTFPAVVTIAMSDSSPQDSGLASGLVNTSRQVGGSLGLAVLASLSASRAGDLLAAGSNPAAALTGGIHAAYAGGLLLIGGAIAVAVLVLRGQPRTAGREDALHLGSRGTPA
jgi:predicted MFS family arabinose efflux permease